MAAYALTVFAGAFLLFQVQPLIAKFILPWFGGGPGVWTICMLFFQVLLVGGYAYAHLSLRWLKPRRQAILHLALLVAALALLPITPSEFWKPSGAANPTLAILGLLTATLGLQYFVLSATAPLVQHWFARANPGASPYRLYALSNAGSLLALLSFPLFFERQFTRKTQAQFWAWGLGFYALGCGWCVLKLLKEQSTHPSPKIKPGGGSEQAINHQLPAINRFLWLLLPACASVLLLGVTNKICQDVAVIPFLWIAPLSLYLLSFIVCFDNPRWYNRLVFAPALILALAGICWEVLFAGTDEPIAKQLGLYLGGLFVCCMVCHGEVYRLRPEPSHLTGYYLMIALGGALGGAFVGAAAPLLFNDYYELHCGLLLCGLLMLAICAQDRTAGSRREWPWLAAALCLAAWGGLDWSLTDLAREKTISRGPFIGLRIGIWAGLGLLAAFWLARKKWRDYEQCRVLTCLWLALGMLALGATLWLQTDGIGGDKVQVSRNFYGVLTLFEHQKESPNEHHFLLQHGRTTHGMQFADAMQAAWPTAYYTRRSGVGLAMGALPEGPRRIGLVGLGAGTLTAYGRTGDYLRIYEINPEVLRLAASPFTYLSNCPARIEIALGDARLSMEREPPQKFDLLALDAFSSDAVPVHLLTKEAFAVYERHLNTNGIIAVHISNHHLDLQPVIANLARHLQYQMVLIDHAPEQTKDEWWDYRSTWALLSRSQERLNAAPIRIAATAPRTNLVHIPLWTDDFASLLQILK